MMSLAVTMRLRPQAPSESRGNNVRLLGSTDDGTRFSDVRLRDAAGIGGVRHRHADAFGLTADALNFVIVEKGIPGCLF